MLQGRTDRDSYKMEAAATAREKEQLSKQASTITRAARALESRYSTAGTKGLMRGQSCSLS